MKFMLALFAAGAMASAGSPVVKRASLVERDAATVSSAIAAINSATETLTEQLNGFQGADQAVELQQASEAVISAINEGESAIAGGEELSQADALTLPTQVQGLADTVDKAVNAAIDKKQAFVDAGLASIVSDQLSQQRDAAQKFSETLISKVPEALQGIGRNLAQPIQDSLNRAVEEFSDVGDAPGSSAGSAEPTGAASSGAASSGAASATTTGSGAEPTGDDSDDSGSAYPTSNGTVPSVTGGAPSPSISQYTGAAAPTAVAGYGAAAMAALAVVAAF